MGDFIKVNTCKMSHKDWLNARRNGIGGSDAPALILPGEKYRWKRPIDIYKSKTESVNEEASLQCRIGTELEGFIADEFTKASGVKVRNYNWMVKNNKYPYMFANIDRKVIGEDAGLECKSTIAYRNNQFTEEEFPMEYYVQIQHYLAVTGWDYWYLGALILNLRFVWYKVERNEKDIKKIIETEKEFWDIVSQRNEEELERWQ